MKYDFTYQNPVRVHFGRNAMENLAGELENVGESVVLIYGGGSIKRNGIYDQVISALRTAGKRVSEISGVMPNPTYAKLCEGIKIAREAKADFLLAVGGGSVIDYAKGVSLGVHATCDVWQHYYIDFGDIINPLVPVGSVLTMAGTGSEANAGSVITNEALKIKAGRTFPRELTPRFAILNPEFTYTVSAYQMKSGAFDAISHLMEIYFSGDDDNVSDYLVEGLLRSLITATPRAVANPRDYEARSNIMWASTLALMTLVGQSKTQDWMVHMIEHQIGAYTDCAHGMGLSAISPAYYRLICGASEASVAKFARFARVVWGVGLNADDATAAKMGIDALEKFIKDSGMVTNLKELGVTEEMIEPIANSAIILDSGYKKLTREEIAQILRESM